MKNVFLNLVKMFARLIKIDNKLVTLLYRGYSGSNLSPIIDRINSGELSDYKIKTINIDKENKLYKNEKIIGKLLNRYTLIRTIVKSKIVITTHGFYRFRNDTIMINLWHGIPFKGMGLMNLSKSDNIGFIQDDYFISTSNFNSTAINACIGLKKENYVITGYPRNDYLFNQNGKENVEKLIGRKIDKKIILYMPTYIDTAGNNHREKNMLGIEEFNYIKFNEFLKLNNYFLILKIHPNEEERFSEIYSEYESDNIFLLKSKQLERNSMDLYKIVNAVDLLLTDFSSIYFDFLLLDRPIVFIPSDLEIHRNTRSFLYEPYDFWTPGPKCSQQSELEFEIIKSLTEKDYFKKEREMISKIVHKYNDGNSSERVINLIKSILNT